MNLKEGCVLVLKVILIGGIVVIFILFKNEMFSDIFYINVVIVIFFDLMGCVYEWGDDVVKEVIVS